MEKQKEIVRGLLWLVLLLGVFSFIWGLASGSQMPYLLYFLSIGASAAAIKINKDKHSATNTAGVSQEPVLQNKPAVKAPILPEPISNTDNLELLLSATHEIIFEMDENDLCKKVWKEADRFLEFPDVYYQEKSVYELFDKPYNIQLTGLFQEVKTDGLARELEFTILQNNEYKTYLAKLKRIQNQARVRVSIVLEDISKRKQIELQQQQQSSFLNNLIAHLPIGVFVKNVKDDLRYTLWNKELENLFLLTEQEVLGRRDEDVFKDAGEIESYIATDQLVLRDKEPLMIQKLSIQAGERQIFARTFKIPILNSNGEIDSILGILENITDVVNSQQELEAAEKRWNYALSGSRDAVWDVNLVTDESFFSSIFNEMLGYEAAEKIADKWEFLVHPEDLVRAWNLFVDHLEGKSAFYECEYRLRNKKGEYIWVLDRGKVAEFDAEGNPTRVIGTYSNIDYRKKLESEYIIALQKAEDASKAKSLFLSTMSHEIRTPMNGVIGIINILINENAHAEQKDNLEALKYSANNLMYLLNDILDFNKIDAGKIDIEERSFDLYYILQNTLKSFVNVAKEKRLELNLSASNNFPKAIIGDPLRLNQIFNNLISNAVKFTHSGGVKVEAITENLSADEIQIRFSIIDTGIGIDEAFLPQLFDQFTQASNDTTRKFGGSGLGLAICKSLVKLLGSELHVKSKKDEGSEFWFSLNFKIDKSKEENKRVQNLDTELGFPGMNLLLVEDNQMNIMVAKNFLNKWEVQTDLAVNGKEALVAVQKKRYDIILMDLQMPEMDGFEATKHLRQAGFQTPVFALTANVNSETKSQVIECGMNEYISKPFNPVELFQLLKQYYKPKKRSNSNTDANGKLF